MTPRGPQGRRDDLLESLCWCTAKNVFLPTEMVRACQTASCGRPDCHEADDGSEPSRWMTVTDVNGNTTRQRLW